MEDHTSFSRSRTADSGYYDDEGIDVAKSYGETEALGRSIARRKADAREARQRNTQEEEINRQNTNRATYEAIETLYLQRVKTRCEREARGRAAKAATDVLKQEEDSDFDSQRELVSRSKTKKMTRRSIPDLRISSNR
jgi:hypothetical protein